jgi:predicted alpha/beta-hydrolase family hydrolase
LELPAPGTPPGAAPSMLRAALDPPATDGGRAVVLLAHGAGLDHDSPFLRDLGQALAERGLPVLRFDYPYATRAAREGRRRPPDPLPHLLAAHRAAAAELRARFPQRPLWLVGKSLGARLSTLLAAAGEPCAGVVCLGYPLHPPRRPASLRTAHFAELRRPCLFLHGTRDPFGTLEELRAALALVPGPAELRAVEGADHSFELPRRAGRSPAEVRRELAGEIAAFLGPPGGRGLPDSAESR